MGVVFGALQMVGQTFVDTMAEQKPSQLPAERHQGEGSIGSVPLGCGAYSVGDCVFR